MTRLNSSESDVAVSIHKKPLRVGQIAKILRLSKKTVLGYVSNGKIIAYRTDGKHYRVWPSDLHAFIEKQAMNVSFLFQETRDARVLVITDRTNDDSRMLKRVLSPITNLSRIVCTSDEYNGYVQFGRTSPQAVVIRFSTINDPTRTAMAKFFASQNVPVFVITENSLNPMLQLSLERSRIIVLKGYDEVCLETKLHLYLKGNIITA